MIYTNPNFSEEEYDALRCKIFTLKNESNALRCDNFTSKGGRGKEEEE